MIPVTVVPATRLCEFISDSLYVLPNRDYYLTKASFRAPKCCCVDNVFGYDFLAVEVDCHNSALTAAEIKDRAGAIVDVLRMGPVADDILPDPNIAIYSGRGIHLIWCINRVSAPCANSIKVTTNAYADVIEQELRYFPCFADFTVDRGYCNNPSGLIRLPGTINTANGAVASYEIYHTGRISIPAGKEPGENRCVVAPAQHDISSTTRTGVARMRAIESLVELRGNLCTGARDIITLIYYCSAVMAGYPAETCESLALRLNASFSVPRPESEVINSLSSAREKRYKYTDDKIISLLDIGNAELAAIGWHAITGKHAKRDAQRARAREGKIAEVLRMREEGQSISAISRITGHSRTTIRKWIAIWNENESVSTVTEESTDTESDQTPSIEDDSLIALKYAITIISNVVNFGRNIIPCLSPRVICPRGHSPPS